MAGAVPNKKVGDAIVDKVDLLQTEPFEIDSTLDGAFADERESKRVANTYEFTDVTRSVNA
jgi:hypothetical protein